MDDFQKLIANVNILQNEFNIQKLRIAQQNEIIDLKNVTIAVNKTNFLRLQAFKIADFEVILRQQRIIQELRSSLKMSTSSSKETT
jgi:hypothetical protein